VVAGSSEPEVCLRTGVVAHKPRQWRSRAGKVLIPSDAAERVGDEAEKEAWLSEPQASVHASRFGTHPFGYPVGAVAVGSPSFCLLFAWARRGGETRKSNWAAGTNPG
jgi:hypothetical protein